MFEKLDVATAIYLGARLGATFGPIGAAAGGVGGLVVFMVANRHS